ncbi:hypothetical protein RRF57_008401 [Xylaria bambusicola]|uniref:SPRY domain-containing protein n=1 Tax=Xylaria bambusicola TaxID=326684 RepID=A0AAN7Z705_9PEZI
MCFTSSDRSDDPPPRPAQLPQKQQQRQSASMPYTSKASIPNDFAPPAGPPASHRTLYQAQETDYAPPSGPPPQPQDFAPPQGPPPSQRAAEEYAPPSGLPPSHDYVPPAGPPPSKNNPFFEDAVPPPGPPPSHVHAYRGEESFDYAPPPGPPPSQDYAAPPGPPPLQEKEQEFKKHDWETAVPDTSLLPPPPNFFNGFDRSPTNNATEKEADAADEWCEHFPLDNPRRFAPLEVAAMSTGNINMFAPPFYQGTLHRESVGVWRGLSPSEAPDTCLATYPPLYSVTQHSPFATRQRKTIYYEVRILEAHISRKTRKEEVSLALGYAAPPYPPFRLPGWQRGSLGVHGDDGHKYINDKWGGKTFTQPFKRGDTLGLGMDFTPMFEASYDNSTPAPVGRILVEIFLTRDGVEAGRWDLHEESDRIHDMPVTGLEGFHDLCASVGVFDKVGFEIIFDPKKWKWQSRRSML